jgi:phosphomannomutase
MRERGAEALALHARWIAEKVGPLPPGKPPRILLDCIHGAAGVLIPRLLRDMGAEVQVMHEEPTGRFPRDPEPTGEAIEALAAEAARRGVDFALAFDPDVDRCAVALPGSEVVGEEWTLPLVAAFLLPGRNGPVVTNLSTSTRLEAVAEASGSRVVRTPVGEAHVVGEMRRLQAALGGEGNGGIIDPQIHLGRDAAVAAAWLTAAQMRTSGGLFGLAARIPERYVTKVKAPVTRGESAEALAGQLGRALGPPSDTRDGLYWRFPDGFVHVRRSATEPVLRLVVEAGGREAAGERLRRVLEAAGVEPEKGV